MQDEKLVTEVNKIMSGEVGENFSISQDGMLTMKGRIHVPDVEDLRKMIMKEAHCLAYAMHSWSGMKRDIVEFVSRYLVCQQVKAEHQRPSRTLQPLHILEWKLFSNGSENIS